MSDPIDNKRTAGISDELRALTRRVDRLERSNRVLKIVSLVALAAVIVATRIPITSAGPSGVINALQYNLYSRSGTLLATLGTNTSGFPSLKFFDSTGNALLRLAKRTTARLPEYTALTATLCSPEKVCRAHRLQSARLERARWKPTETGFNACHQAFRPTRRSAASFYMMQNRLIVAKLRKTRTQRPIRMCLSISV